MLDTRILDYELDLLMKGRRANIGEVRRFGDSDYKKTTDGWEYVGKNDLYEVNERFNEELRMQIEGTLSKDHKYNIGRPGRKLLDAGFPDREIHMMARTLSLKSSKRYKSHHPFDLRNVRNLPFALNHPIFVFESKTQPTSKVVITDLKEGDTNLLAALQVDFKEKESVVISIRSIYPKENPGVIKGWIDEGLLVWRDKGKALRFSSKLQSNSAEVGEKIKAFKNPSLSGPKDREKNWSDQQSIEKSLVLDIEKSRKGLPIGTTKEFSVNGRRVLYIKTEKGWRPKSKGGPLRSKQEDGGMGIKVSDFSDKTRELFDEAKKDNKLLRNFVDQLIEADFPSKDIFTFIKKEFKLGPKSRDHYEDVLQLKAYWRPSTGEFSDKNEVASWLHDEVMRMTKSKNPHGETLDPEQTKELIEKFQKRYDLDSYSQAEKILKGLAFNGTKEYTMAFDTNFGQYHFYIGKRRTEESSKKESLLYTDKDIRVVEIRAFAENEFQNRINSFVRYKGKNYAVTALTSKDANARGYTIHIDKVTYLNSGVKESKERDRAIVWALNHSLYQDFESTKDSSKEEQKETLEETSPTIKQITQTYVKVGGDTILIRMNKDKTRYKASKGDFKVESGEGEDLTSFKNRIKEEYERRSKPKETALEKDIREALQSGSIEGK